MAAWFGTNPPRPSPPSSTVSATVASDTPSRIGRYRCVRGAILQGFPEYYSFVPDGAPIHFKSLGRMIGNAVPVTLGRIIGRSILRHLAVAPETKMLDEITRFAAERERKAKREPLVA